jgi:hypothetical protein
MGLDMEDGPGGCQLDPQLGALLHQARGETIMATMLRQAEPTAMTGCEAIEISWHLGIAAKTRKMCEYETDQECICAEGEDCWLV